MVLGFVVFWPIGLAILAYMIWGKQMFGRNGKSCGRRAAQSRTTMRPSGNSAFDAYKADMLQRLEDEQTAFDDFLRRLREARDKAEFDSFMEDRARARREAGSAEA